MQYYLSWDDRIVLLNCINPTAFIQYDRSNFEADDRARRSFGVDQSAAALARRLLRAWGLDAMNSSMKCCGIRRWCEKSIKTRSPNESQWSIDRSPLFVRFLRIICITLWRTLALITILLFSNGNMLNALPKKKYEHITICTALSLVPFPMTIRKIDDSHFGNVQFIYERCVTLHSSIDRRRVRPPALKRGNYGSRCDTWSEFSVLCSCNDALIRTSWRCDLMRNCLRRSV